MQTGLRHHIGQARQLRRAAFFFLCNGLRLLRGHGDGAAELFTPGSQCALGKLGFLQLALKSALLIARFTQLALSLNHAVVKLGMPFLAVGQLHVEFFKTALSHGFALFQVAQLRFKIRHIQLNLRSARAGLFGQLRQAQHFYLQRVGAALRLCCGAAG